MVSLLLNKLKGGPFNYLNCNLLGTLLYIKQKKHQRSNDPDKLQYVLHNFAYIRVVILQVLTYGRLQRPPEHVYNGLPPTLDPLAAL